VAVVAAPTPAVAETCPLVRVHFAFDEALIRSDDLPALDKVARCLRRNVGQRIVIEGNADERGTEEYNLMLSSKRAASVERYLNDLGVSREQMDSVSYGDERPLCTSHEESCWAQNRRVALQPQ
jgi:peptidoglycan-associated lipoprotein